MKADTWTPETVIRGRTVAYWMERFARDEVYLEKIIARIERKHRKRKAA